MGRERESQERERGKDEGGGGKPGHHGACEPKRGHAWFRRDWKRGPNAAAEMFTGGGLKGVRTFRLEIHGLLLPECFSVVGSSRTAGREAGIRVGDCQSVRLQRQLLGLGERKRSPWKRKDSKNHPGGNWKEHREKGWFPATRGRSAPAHLNIFQRRWIKELHDQ